MVKIRHLIATGICHDLVTKIPVYLDIRGVVCKIIGKTDLTQSSER